MTVLDSLRVEFARYRQLAEDAIAQVDEPALSQAGPGGGSSIAIIAFHVAGNLTSRFTDFLTTDGEKPWRDRETEFETRVVTRDELLTRWTSGWDVLVRTLTALTDADLQRTVSIRGEQMPAHRALHRALAHVSYHVGQIVYLAKAARGAEWRYLSIPPAPTSRATER
jgi:hypothetical protein